MVLPLQWCLKFTSFAIADEYGKVSDSLTESLQEHILFKNVSSCANKVFKLHQQKGFVFNVTCHLCVLKKVMFENLQSC